MRSMNTLKHMKTIGDKHKYIRDVPSHIHVSAVR